MSARAVAVAAAAVTLPVFERWLRVELLKIRPAVTWLAPNTLERTAKKTQLLEKPYES